MSRVVVITLATTFAATHSYTPLSSRDRRVKVMFPTLVTVTRLAAGKVPSAFVQNIKQSHSGYRPSAHCPLYDRCASRNLSRNKLRRSMYKMWIEQILIHQAWRPVAFDRTARAAQCKWSFIDKVSPSIHHTKKVLCLSVSSPQPIHIRQRWEFQYPVSSTRRWNCLIQRPWRVQQEI